MEEINIKELLNYFKTKIGWIILTILLVVGLGNTYRIFTREPLYKSDTSIILVSSTNQTTANFNDIQANRNLVTTYTEIIKSRKVLEPVIENLELDYSYGTLKSNVSVGAIGDTQMIKISVSDRNPKKAQRIADEIAEVFMNEVKDIYQLENVRVVDSAVAENKPYNINYIKDNIIFVGIGFVISCGIILLVFYFDTTIKTSEEIEEKLGLTVIGMVPKMRDR